MLILISNEVYILIDFKKVIKMEIIRLLIVNTDTRKSWNHIRDFRPRRRGAYPRKCTI